MTLIRAKKILSGRLNSDDARTITDTSDTLDAWNVRLLFDKDSSTLRIDYVAGTRGVASPHELRDDAKVLGSAWAPDEDMLFFFLYTGSPGDQGIYCYFPGEEVIRPVLRGQDVTTGTLGFAAGHLIHSAAVVGDQLFWTDGLNPPRRLNFRRGLAAYGFGPGDPYPLGSITPQMLTVARPAPALAPTFEKIQSDQDAAIPDRTNNFISDGAFQFAYRYLYRDKEPSVLSPLSLLANYDNEDQPERYDTIKVLIPLGETIPEDVEKVQLLFRNGNAGSFYIFRELTRSEDGAAIDAHNGGVQPLTAYFYNDEFSVILSDEVAYKPFDNVPLTSQALEIARNRLFLGNNVYGYDRVRGLTLSAQINSAGEGVLNPKGPYFYLYVFYGDEDSSGRPTCIWEYERVLVKIDVGEPYDGWYETDVDYAAFRAGTAPAVLLLSPANRRATLQEAPTLQDLRDKVVNDLNYCTGQNQNEYLESNTFGNPDPEVRGITGTVGVEDGIRHIKSNSAYALGVVFYDYARRNAAVYSPVTVYTPKRTYINNNWNLSIGWAISATPDQIPAWATHYALVRTRNLTYSSFVQFRNGTRQYVRKDADGNYVLEDDYRAGETLGIAWDASPLVADGLGYTFQAGDQLIAYPAVAGAEPLTLRVLDQYGQYVISDYADLGDPIAGGFYLCELYSPYKSAGSDEPFFEVGSIYPIIAPGSANRSLSVTAGVLPGDTYLKLREGIYTEAMNVSKRHYLEWLTDVGHPNIKDLEVRRRVKPTGIAYSNTFIQDSNVNGLSSFEALDQVILDERFGPINKLILSTRSQEYGSVLLALCSEEAVSIYLGQTQIIDDEGQALLATSGRVIGTINALRGGWGCVHPESAVANEGYVYYISAREGKVVRYASNGLEPISEQKLARYMAEYCRQTQQGAHLQLPGGYDPYQEEYLLCLPPMAYRWPVHLEDYGDQVISSWLLRPGQEVLWVLYQQRYEFSLTPRGGAGPIHLRYEPLGGSVVTILSATADAPGFLDWTAPEPGRIFFESDDGTPGELFVSSRMVNPHDMHNGQGRTLAFNERLGAFTGSYSFLPEALARANLRLISFYRGALYVHDSDERNTFYGSTYPSSVAVLFNEAGPIVKTLETLALEAATPPYWTHVRTETPYVQSSDLVQQEWDEREGIYYAGILRDRLTPGAGTYDEKQIRGDKIRGQYILVYMMWLPQQGPQLGLLALNAGMNRSHGHIPLEQNLER